LVIVVLMAHCVRDATLRHGVCAGAYDLLEAGIEQRVGVDRQRALEHVGEAVGVVQHQVGGDLVESDLAAVVAQRRSAHLGIGLHAQHRQRRALGEDVLDAPCVQVGAAVSWRVSRQQQTTGRSP
jgi:hypothetical protein